MSEKTDSCYIETGLLIYDKQDPATRETARIRVLTCVSLRLPDRLSRLIPSFPYPLPTHTSPPVSIAYYHLARPPLTYNTRPSVYLHWHSTYKSVAYNQAPNTSLYLYHPPRVQSHPLLPNSGDRVESHFAHRSTPQPRRSKLQEHEA
jgi:hypothetical protein